MRTCVLLFAVHRSETEGELSKKEQPYCTNGRFV